MLQEMCPSLCRASNFQPVLGGLSFPGNSGQKHRLGEILRSNWEAYLGLFIFTFKFILAPMMTILISIGN
ncbi:MAG: hypothetical protein DRJ06_08245 [Candidatus Aminicenantes bacterium]|nr:MAG: hypothetical protein DRJ06_08245 [Candidatus Aminicenantes bacterium]